MRGPKLPLNATSDDPGEKRMAGSGDSGSLPRCASPSQAEYQSHGHVLVVDDEPSVARLTSLILEQCGFEVSVAANGADALAVISANQDSLRLVLMDFSMPDFDGFAVLAAARNLGCEVPMILTTGYPAERDAGPARGFAGSLLKPYRFDSLVGVLREVLNE